MFGINGLELVLLVVAAFFVLGPERMPVYAAKLARGIRQLRGMADSAKGELRKQMGPDFDDINWRQYDPRQYDPRRIVREALLDPAPASQPLPSTGGTTTTAYDPDRPTPWDSDAT